MRWNSVVPCRGEHSSSGDEMELPAERNPLSTDDLLLLSPCPTDRLTGDAYVGGVMKACSRNLQAEVLNDFTSMTVSQSGRGGAFDCTSAAVKRRLVSICPERRRELQTYT